MNDTLSNEIRKNFQAMADEEKANCIHCNTEWYVIHYKDGVCHSCQQKGLPGRTKLKKKEKLKSYFKLFFILFIGLPIGFYISDILGHHKTGIIVYVIVMILLLFPFGLLKVSIEKRPKPKK